MTRRVASVNGGTPFKDVAEVLVNHEVSAAPVVDGEGHVIGMVSEADLLRKEQFRERYHREGYRPPLRTRLRERVGRKGAPAERRARGDTARDLMTRPAITVKPHADVVTAARLMSEHGIKRLPVVDDDGVLEGIVSRHDLLTVFARTDDAIAREVRDDVVEGPLWARPPAVRVSVSDGVVTLSGRVARTTDARIAVGMTGRVNGVVDVVDELECEDAHGGGTCDEGA
ncbi:CBS domain-containing protein [Sphaerisporangium sp. TRM90804]|uniref:CBS domain-containing protein n=1 Tax=Sphaerisporangium sp. TRM90804 TaxID=3031113 RepID=UPI00244A0C13|nr:CBS domain-containing protein [Sphaerisporangium sp. TRM90804]MDH2430817.1 CBS domain-containing protein [Sphaerisporangium sp. TRM90804]